MEIIRSNKYNNYFKNQYTIEHNTGLVAVENDIVGILEYKILNKYEIEIVNLETTDNSLLKLFIEKILFWNPYVKNIVYKKSSVGLNKEILLENGFIEKIIEYRYANPNPLKLYKLNMEEIKISQLSVSEEKVERVSRWIESPKDIIVNLYSLDNNIICIDGNSRLVAGYNKGIKDIHGYFTEDDNEELFRENIKWCEAEGINNISDLSKRIVSSEEHKEIWIDRCQEFFNRD